MGALRYTHPDDEVGQFATVTVEGGTAETGYEATYANDFTPANIGHPARSSSASALNLQLAFAAPQRLKGFGFWHSTDENLVITFKGNSSASWTSPPFTGSVTALAKRGDGRTRKLAALLDQTYKYWLIELPTNASVKPGLKFQAYSDVRAFSGYNADQNQHFQWGMHAPNAQLGIDHPTAFGFHWHYNLGVGNEALTGPLAVRDSDVAALKEWHQATGGRALTLFMSDSDLAEAFLGRIALGPALNNASGGAFVSVLDVQQVAPDYNVVTLSIEDMTAGGSEWG